MACSFFTTTRRRLLLPPLLVPSSQISSLKVPWKKDPFLDAAIERDKRYLLCSRVVREVLNESFHRIPLRYLEKRRLRLRLPIKIRTFLSRYPNLFDIYPDRIKPNSPPVPFLKPSSSLLSFLAFDSSLRKLHENSSLAKLCKLLMISRDRAISTEKLLNVKRDFGFPDDFLTSLVPNHPHLLRLVGNPGEGKSFLELVSWDDSFAKSVIESHADAESELTGIRLRPNFTPRLPRGFYLKKEMREWIRDWLELPYISPYADVSTLHSASPEMEKRMVGVLHEVLSMTLNKRMAVPVIGKFCEELRLSNAFGNVFTRHPGIFYVSLKGGIKTAVLRGAYDERGELVDRDPLLEIKDKFVEMMEEGHREYMERLRRKKEELQGDLELLARKNAAESNGEEEEEEEEEEEKEKEENRQSL